jgi:outer membrane protein
MKLYLKMILIFMFSAGCLMPTFLHAGEYSLGDLFIIALKQSEKIQYSQENLTIAKIGKTKALSVLIPRVIGYGSYTEFKDRQYDDYGYLTQPDSGGAWGIRADETFSLGLREFTALSMADTGIKKSSLDLDNTKEEFMLQVARSYFDCLRASRQYDIAKANLERLTQYRDMADKRLKVGEATKTVLLRAEGELSGSKSEMVNAGNAVNLTRAILIRLTGIEPDFTLKELNVEDKELPGLESLMESAYANRSDLKSFDYMKKLAAQQKTYAVGAYFPNITLTGLYQKTDQSPGDLNRVPETQSLGASVNFPLFVGGYRKADVDEAKAKYRQAEYLYEDMKKNIAVEVETAWLEVKARKQAIGYLTDQVAFAKNNYYSVSRQFEVGLANSIDLLDANTLLLTSERTLTNETYALQTAILKLKRATGELLKITGK